LTAKYKYGVLDSKIIENFDELFCFLFVLIEDYFLQYFMFLKSLLNE